jgi:hypothetical protein
MHRRWIWLWLLLGTALVVRAGIRDRGVIIDHLEFGRRLLLGLDLYAPYLDPKPLHAPYPPSFGLLTAPFWLLGERLGASRGWHCRSRRSAGSAGGSRRGCATRGRSSRA